MSDGAKVFRLHASGRQTIGDAPARRKGDNVGEPPTTVPPPPPPPPTSDMEARITSLETKWDAVVPTLATKSDLADVRTDFAGLRADFAGLRGELRSSLSELRADMHKADSQHKTWVLSTVLAVIGTAIALAGYLTNILKPAAPAAAPQPTVVVVPSAVVPAPVTTSAQPPAPAASR